MKPLVSVENLGMVRGKRVILQDINLEIMEGEILGVIGLSGSGKTTLLSLIASILKPTSGKIMYHMHLKDKSDLTRQIGLALQFPSFYPELTCIQNLEYFSRMYGLKSNKSAFSQLLKGVGLEGHEKYEGKHLSGGMQKKLDLACSILHNPKLLLLDEPTANLDPLNRNDIWSLIQDLKTSGMTIVLASHFLDEVEQLSNRTAILHDHQIQGIEDTEHLKRNRKGRLHEILSEIVKGK